MLLAVHDAIFSRSITCYGPFLNKRTFIKLSDTALQERLKPSFLYDPLNSVTSMSQINHILTKSQSFRQTASENHQLQGKPLLIKQYYKYSLIFLKFLKIGVQNVWLNKKALNLLVKDGQLGHQSIEALTETIYKRLKTQSQDLLISRSLYQTILRTRRDIIKLPIFGSVVLIFGEFTPLICYLFPYFTLSTCLLPQLFRRYYSGPERAQEQLERFEGEFDGKREDSRKVLIFLCDVFQVRSHFIPSLLIPESVLKEKLEARCKEIIVDNHLILRNGGIWGLLDLEILNACIQRGILNFSTFDKLKATNDKSFYQQINFGRLRLKLFESMLLFSQPDIEHLLAQLRVARKVDQMNDSEVGHIIDRVKRSAESQSMSESGL